MRIDPNSITALTGPGAALMSERFGNSGEAPAADVTESERVAQRAFELAPNSSVALINWANVLLLRGDPNQTLPVYEKATLRAPSNANAHLRFASALLLVGRAVEMQAPIDMAMRLGYRDSRIMATAYFVSAQAAFAQGEEDKAYALATRSIVERPNYGVSYLHLALIDAREVLFERVAGTTCPTPRAS